MDKRRTIIELLVFTALSAVLAVANGVFELGMPWWLVTAPLWAPFVLLIGTLLALLLFFSIRFKLQK